MNMHMNILIIIIIVITMIIINNIFILKKIISSAKIYLQWKLQFYIFYICR